MMDYALTLAHLEGRIKALPNISETLNQTLQGCAQREVSLGQELSAISLSKDFYRKALDVIYKRSVGEITHVLNEALAYIYHDCTYRVELLLEDKRSAKQLEIEIIDYSFDPPLALDVKDGVGAGIRAVVSFTLHLYFLLNKGSYPVLFLDETYSSISEAYKDRFFTFISDLSKAKGFTTVFITHTSEATEYADKLYQINNGEVREVFRDGTGKRSE